MINAAAPPSHNKTDHALSRAFLIRSFEERLLKLFSEGKLFGTVHTCIGQEFSGIAVAEHLRLGDVIFSNHRCHGHYLARTGDVHGLMAEVMGRQTGVCGGRGGSQHICAGGVISNGVQGGIAPVAAGWALAQTLAQNGNIVVAFIGDGTLGEGVLYETLNIISKWQLPLMIVLENNGYAQSTSFSQTLAGDIIKRAEAFGIPGYHGDTWDPDGLTALMGRAIRQVREGPGPAFVRVDTYRLMAHSKGDDDRPRSEVEHYWSIDPLTQALARDGAQATRLRQDADDLVSSAVSAALDAPFAKCEPAHPYNIASPAWKPTVIEGRDRVVLRIHQALREQMTNDRRSFILGEDIEGPYGGAFKVTKDLSLLFPGRVRNTPISEAAIVGIGNGLAMAGMRPVCEIMFGDFLALAADQIINHAAKFHWMYNEQITVPVIVRTPMGGKRGYGATHSQSIEKHFFGLPGTQVLALHHRYDPAKIYQQLFRSIDRPTLVIENKSLYGEYVTHTTTPGFWCEHTDDDFPTTRIRSTASPDITILCYGGCLTDAEKALDRLFEDHEIIGEIICPSQLYPLRLDPIIESVKKSGRMLVVEEGQLFCGFGAEVLAAVHEACPGQPLLMRRQGAAPHPIPSCKPAELDGLPGVDSIVRDCVAMVLHG
ncbi:MAG TPA: thiamine pyrophosphate-dependent enzyme [Bryobacteraceae bacterium]|nr:thiamine pyrophosphate-dependent enzyme [Bryobacteraceae bacterium]